MKQKAQISVVIDYDKIPKYLLYLLEQEGTINQIDVCYADIKKFLFERKTLDAKNSVVEMREMLLEMDAVLANIEGILSPTTENPAQEIINSPEMTEKNE